MKKIFFIVLIVVATGLRAAPEYPQMGPDIYDPQADGSVLIATALKQARSEHKRVLIDLGANWCPWCRRLHRALTSDTAVAEAVARGYILIMVDANTRRDPHRNDDVDARFDHPLRVGLPVFVVVDANGDRLTTQPTDKLDDEHGQPRERLLAFLEQWMPSR